MKKSIIITVALILGVFLIIIYATITLNDCQKLAIKLDEKINTKIGPKICDNYPWPEIWVGGTLINKSCSYASAYNKYECDLGFQGIKKQRVLHISSKSKDPPFVIGQFYKFNLVQYCVTLYSMASSGNFPAAEENIIPLNCLR